jgi:hypothetical protein
VLDESGLSIDGAVAAGLVAAIDARPLKEIAGKRKGGEIGGAPSYTHHPPAPRLRSTPGARVSPYIPLEPHMLYILAVAYILGVNGGVSHHRKAAAADAADPAHRPAAARLASQLELAPKGIEDVLRRKLLDAASPQEAARAGWIGGGAPPDTLTPSTPQPPNPLTHPRPSTHARQPTL